MTPRNVAIGVHTCLLVATLCSLPLAAEGSGPIKHYIMIDLAPSTDTLVLDRWYITHHGPETLARTRHAQSRYVTYRTYSMSETDQERFNAVSGRMTEIGFPSLEVFQAGFTPEARARVEITPRSPEMADAMEVISVTIPEVADITVKDAEPGTKLTPYFRWILFLSYPDGVSAAEGDAWLQRFLETSVAGRGDVSRILIYRGVRDSNPYPRVVETWFDDRAAWNVAVGAGVFDQATPWGGIFELDTRSAFIGERPDIDFRVDERVIP